MTITRRSLFTSLLSAGASAAAYAKYVEPTWFEVTRTRVPFPMPRGRTMRVLHLSDFHASDGLPVETIEIAVAAGLEQKPDLICLTGDYVSNTVGFDETGLRRMLGRLAAAAPCYAVMGNHDGGEWLQNHGGDGTSGFIRRIVAGSGVDVLHNRSAVVDVRGQRVQLAGVGDRWSDELDAGAAFAGQDPALPTIVLCHNPDGKEEFARQRWQLMLSGHTHGGQVVAPLVTPLWAPVKDKRFISGLYDWNGRKLFITRGVGSPKRLRFSCRPEVSLLLLG
ncbi:MAG: phosphodiesterase YaeI [Bryobacteraceae bacterium]|nr:phosphodiesterase YaeI [Bryobacteraceae bacterium]